LGRLENDILETMRLRISLMRVPAYIKDSALNFLAVNQAFADIFGLRMQAFSGASWADIVDMGRVSEWSEGERRCLAFGQDETIVFNEVNNALAHVAMMKRFEATQGEFLICCVTSPGLSATDAEAGLTQALASVSVTAPTVFSVSQIGADATLQEIARYVQDRFAENFDDMVRDADFQDYLADRRIGLLVYDSRDVLRFANSAFYEIYEPYRGAIVPGMHVADVLGVAYDTIIAADRQKTIVGYEAKREAWVARRMQVHALPLSDIEIRMPDGRWVRTYNQRFENDINISLRMDVTTVKINGGSGAVPEGDIGCGTSPLEPMSRSGVRPAFDRASSTPLENEGMNGLRGPLQTSCTMEKVLDGMPVGVLVVSQNLVIEYANTVFCEQIESRLGQSRQLVGMPLRAFINGNMEAGFFPQGMTSRLMSIDERLAFIQAATGETEEFGLFDGLVVSFRSHRLSDGRLLLTYSDLSDLRRQDAEVQQARQQLIDSDRLMAQIASVMGQGVLVIEAGRIVFANPAAYRLLGLPAGLLGENIRLEDGYRLCVQRGDFIGDELAVNKTFDEIRSAITNGEKLSRLLLLKSLQLWITIDLLPLEDSRVAAVLTDVTQQQHREKELEGLILRAEQADRTKTQLLTSIGHEIRMPMGGVIAMTDLLQKSSLDTRQRTFVDIIANSGQSLMTIVKDIVDASKMGTGSLTLTNSAFSPADAIADVATLMSDKASERSIDLVIRCDPGVPAGIVGDVARFRRILTLLVGNALKFTEAGYVLISAETHSDADNGKHLRVQVMDTGPGITPEYLAKFNAIFEEFHQSHTHVEDNTGLGLSIVAGLASLMGGRMRAESIFGQGAKMILDLPYDTKNETPYITPAGTVFADTRMIVIDRQAMSREILVEHLKSQGVDAIGVEDGHTAFELIEQAAEAGLAVDAVIASAYGTHADIVLCLEKLRGDSRFSNMAVVAIKALDMISSECLQQNVLFDAYVLKPVRMNLLQKVLLDIVARRKRLSVSEPVSSKDDGVPAAVPQGGLYEGADPIVGRRAIDVLVVEDNHVNQCLLSQVLEGLGCRFRLVGDERAAVQAFQDMQPRLILMDVTLPGGSGYEASRRIRQIEAGRKSQVRIVGLVPGTADVDSGEWAKAGMDACLAKPLNPLNLEEAIGVWLGTDEQKQVA
jgi:signal transduction histidine kinase/CheY-like chemotaxis protein